MIYICEYIKLYPLSGCRNLVDYTNQTIKYLYNKFINIYTAAMDIHGLKVTVVLAEPFRSEVLARQTLGRTRDDNTYYIDCVDDGFFYCKSYFSSKKPIFSKYATNCTNIVMNEFEIHERLKNIPRLICPVTRIDQ